MCITLFVPFPQEKSFLGFYYALHNQQDKNLSSLLGSVCLETHWVKITLPSGCCIKNNWHIQSVNLLIWKNPINILWIFFTLAMILQIKFIIFKKKKKNTNIFTLIAYSAKCLDDSMGNSGSKKIYVCKLPPPAYCLKDFVIQLPFAWVSHWVMTGSWLSCW